MGVMPLDGITKRGKVYEKGVQREVKEGFVITDVKMYRNNNKQQETN
jgi:hypothetical protein